VRANGVRDQHPLFEFVIFGVAKLPRIQSFSMNAGQMALTRMAGAKARASKT